MENSVEVPSKKSKVELPHDPAISLLGIDSKEMKIGSQRETCTPTFIAALFTITKMWKKFKCPSVNGWIQMFYTHTP